MLRYILIGIFTKTKKPRAIVISIKIQINIKLTVKETKINSDTL